MSQPQMPADRSVELRQLELDAADRKGAADKVTADQRKQELLGLRNNAVTSGTGAAKDYFSQQGLVPDDYSSAINSKIQQILSGIAPDDPNPGAYFSDVGSQVYDTAQTGQRNKAQRDLDRIFSPNFETTRIPYTLDDPTLGAIEAEQRTSADGIIRNMLNRGVITGTGYDAATKDLDRQSSGVKARLSEVGNGILAQGQQGQRDIANRGRSTASNLNLGTQFDPYSFSSEADNAFNDFLQNLGGKVRAAAPGNLFNTSGLAALAGSAQGAGNTAFNPNALAGLTDEEDDDENQSENVF